MNILYNISSKVHVFDDFYPLFVFLSFCYYITLLQSAQASPTKGEFGRPLFFFLFYTTLVIPNLNVKQEEMASDWPFYPLN